MKPTHAQIGLGGTLIGLFCVILCFDRLFPKAHPAAPYAAQGEPARARVIEAHETEATPGFSTPIDSPKTTPRDVSLSPGGSESSLVAGGASLAQLREMEPGFLPTAEGLYEYTHGVWDETDFLALTPAEAAELLPIPEFGFDATLPGTLTSIFGDLPTKADCTLGMLSNDVVQHLTALCGYDAWLIDALDPTQWCDTPKEGPRAEMLARARELRDDAEEKLWAALDRETGYHSWTLYGRAFRAWLGTSSSK